MNADAAAIIDELGVSRSRAYAILAERRRDQQRQRKAAFWRRWNVDLGPELSGVERLALVAWVTFGGADALIEVEHGEQHHL